ncbi:MAG: carboxypeptidase M32 [Rhodobacteraceae bacterium]|nr:carboxypeptidase M32 [Paracoccaceae bacterium]
MEPFSSLMAYVKDTRSLEYLTEILEWDQAAKMPHSAIEQRADSLGALTNVIHDRHKSSLIGDMLAKIDTAKLSLEDKAQIREIKRSFERANKIPSKLERAIEETTARANIAWEQALKANDFQKFKPELEKVIQLKREQGVILSSGGNPYDGLLEDYEAGMTSENLDVFFGELKPRLNKLRDQILAREEFQTPSGKKYSKEEQIKLAKELARLFGYDFERGRIDTVTHPFCVGTGSDVRLTTRIDEQDPFNCLYSTIHEAGHGSYEQNIDKKFCLTPIGKGASFGVHESQSRICENQLGRSREFAGWLYQRMREVFGEIGLSSIDEFYRWINQVKKGYIRTEADEVQYNLHIILRYELEKLLITGSLDVDDLEDAWNQKFLEYFGYPVKSPKDGVLQDVHWSLGLFGYFPTYALGNVYAGCLYDTMNKQIDDLGSSLAKGNTTSATKWLRENIHQFGALREPRETIEWATGATISSTYLLDYLENKFTEIYSL